MGYSRCGMSAPWLSRQPLKQKWGEQLAGKLWGQLAHSDHHAHPRDGPPPSNIQSGGDVPWDGAGGSNNSGENGPVAQRRSCRLITAWSLLRIQPGLSELQRSGDSRLPSSWYSLPSRLGSEVGIVNYLIGTPAGISNRESGRVSNTMFEYAVL